MTLASTLLHDEDVILHLLQEELKYRKLLHTLEELGVEDSGAHPNLDPLIMRFYFGITDTPNEIQHTYQRTMITHSQKISNDADSNSRQAHEVHHEILRSIARYTAPD